MMRPRSIQRWLLLACAALSLVRCLAGQPVFDATHAQWTELLKANMREGRVDYAHLAQNRGDLDEYLSSTAAVTRVTFDAWNRRDQLAFLINVYNAATIRLVRDHYPVTSIRKIGGLFRSPWSLECVQLFGEAYSLDDVEHDLIRKRYNEPRIHFALVCAARGCPPLRPRAYVGESLEADLDEQGRLFLAQPEKNRVDRQAGIVWLSPIFNWYGRDFLLDGKTIVEAVAPWLPADDAQFVRTNRVKVRFTEYDWSLNDVAKP